MSLEFIQIKRENNKLKRGKNNNLHFNQISSYNIYVGFYFRGGGRRANKSKFLSIKIIVLFIDKDEKFYKTISIYDSIYC